MEKNKKNLSDEGVKMLLDLCAELSKAGHTGIIDVDAILSSVVKDDSENWIKTGVTITRSYCKKELAIEVEHHYSVFDKIIEGTVVTAYVDREKVFEKTLV